MDNITHTLVGLMLSRCGIDRKIPRGAALMMMAANVPDIDGVTFLMGAEKTIEWHRWYTHALISSPVMAMIPVLLLLAFKRQRITLWAWFFSWIAVLSHLALDWTNMYGIRLLLPFSHQWFRLDMTELFDPWILATLFLALAAPALASLVSTEIASARRAKAGPKRGWAWFAILVLIGYEGVRYVSHDRAIEEMNAHTYNGVIARRVTAVPTGTANIWKWKGIVEGPDFVTIMLVDLNETFDATAGRIEYPAPPSPAMEAARATKAFQVFESFDQVPFWKSTPVDAGTEIELIDLRFGSPEHPGFEASAIVDNAGVVRDSHVRFGR